MKKKRMRYGAQKTNRAFVLLSTASMFVFAVRQAAKVGPIKMLNGHDFHSGDILQTHSLTFQTSSVPWDAMRPQ